MRLSRPFSSANALAWRSSSTCIPPIVASRRLSALTPAGQPAAGCLAPLGCASIRSRSAR
jgi:hypothetical protein